MRDAVVDLARRQGVPFTMVECSAPREMIHERLAARGRSDAEESDARSDLFDEFAKHFEPMHELSTSGHLRLDTSRPLSENRKRLEAMFEI
jgi:predicted kinase